MRFNNNVHYCSIILTFYNGNVSLRLYFPLANHVRMNTSFLVEQYKILESLLMNAYYTCVVLVGNVLKQKFYLKEVSLMFFVQKFKPVKMKSVSKGVMPETEKSYGDKNMIKLYLLR